MLPGGKRDGEFLNTLSDVQDKAVVIRDLSVPGLDIVSDGVTQHLEQQQNILFYSFYFTPQSVCKFKLGEF